MFKALWEASTFIVIWVIPIVTAAVGTNLISQALCQRTMKESHETEINRQPTPLQKHIRKKFEKYKRWSPNDTNRSENIDIENYLSIK